MDLVKFLTQFNLTEKEAGIYLACLSQSAVGINELTRLSNCDKRSTVIFWLKRLKERGLIKETRQKNKRMFVAIDPNEFLEKNKKAVESLELIIPQLQAMRKYEEKQKPTIRLYDSLSGLKLVYEELLTDRPKEFRSIGNNDALMALDDDYFKKYRLRRFKSDIKARLLIVDNKWGQEIMRVQKKFNIEARLLPKEYGFESEIMCWNDKVATMYYSKPLFVVVVIESVPIAEIHRNIFEMLWRWSVRE